MISHWAEGRALWHVVFRKMKATKESGQIALRRIIEKFLLFLRGRGGEDTEAKKRERRAESRKRKL